MLFACSICEKGTYSFDPTDQSCKTCPKEAFSCEKNIALIKPGYWRSKKNNLEIMTCSPFDQSCL